LEIARDDEQAGMIKLRPSDKVHLAKSEWEISARKVCFKIGNPALVAAAMKALGIFPACLPPYSIT
jgi:hypothetical protein